MTLCEVLWWNHSRSVTKNLTPYRFNSAGWGYTVRTLILTLFDHFHFRPTSGLLSSQDLTYCHKRESPVMVLFQMNVQTSSNLLLRQVMWGTYFSDMRPKSCLSCQIYGESISNPHQSSMCPELQIWTSCEQTNSRRLFQKTHFQFSFPRSSQQIFWTGECALLTCWSWG